MPTVQQLPQAVSVNPTDEIMIDQDGVSVAATVQQVVAAGGTTLTLIGDVTGSGTGTIITTLAPVVTPGTFNKVSVNAKGQVIAGGALAAADIDTALGFVPYSAANPSGFVAGTALAPVATSGAYSDLSGRPTLGSLAAQNANSVALTGGTASGVDISGAKVTASNASQARSAAVRAADLINVLDFGADPTGTADSSPAFVAAMNTVPNGSWGQIFVPHGTYLIGSFVNQPAGRSIAVVFEEGATITGSGFGVDRIESKQGPFSLWQGGGGYFGFTPSRGSPVNYAFRSEFIQNTNANSAATRNGWSRNYTNYNYYGKYVSGIDIAEQNIFSWPYLYDNSSGWGHWEIINCVTYDEDSSARAHINGSGEHSEFDIVNNAPEAGWTWKSGQGLNVQGMSIDPWGQNGFYGGNILYSYGSVGSFDGQGGGLNRRWPSYPAVFSIGNPAPLPQNSTLVITFDLTAHGSASLNGAGGVGSVSVSTGGGGYTSAPTVMFSGGGGSGAAGTAILNGASVVGVTITAAGGGYTSPPSVSFTGGGVAAPVATTVTLNSDGAHGDLLSARNAINAANIPNLKAAVAQWGGIVSRLVIFGTANYDLGSLTLGGTALATLGIAAGSNTTQRDSTVVVFGGTSGASAGDQLTLNGTTITVGGTGALSDVVAAISAANLVGVTADINANGALVLTAWVPQNPGGLVIGQPNGFSTLQKLGLSAGTFWPPTPPKAFATAYGELTSPVCRTTDQLSVAATDLNGTSYGPITVTLNGGGGTGWPADVAASINAALIAAGFHSSSFTTLTAPPGVVVATAHGSGGSQGVLIRNTAGGSLTLANVTGTPLATLGMTPGTYQPGGYSAGSQSVFMAAEDSIAPQGRGIFLGGASTATDQTVWPHAPLEARGSFLHGLRTDKATFADNAALLLGAGQTIAFGTGAGSLTLANSNGTLQVNGASVAVPTAVSQLTNDAGYITAAAIPPAGGMLLGGSGSAGGASAVALGANLTLAGGTLSATSTLTPGVATFNGRNGAVSLTSADVTGALTFTPVNKAGDTMAALAVSGSLTAPTAAAGDSSSNVATTAFVAAALAALFSFTAASGPAPLQIYQRTSQSGTPITNGTLAGIGRGAGPVSFTITSTGLAATVQYRLYDANSSGASATTPGSGTALSGWITTSVGFATGNSTVTLSLPASAYDYYIDLAPSLSTGAPVRVASKFSVGERVAVFGQSLAVDWWFAQNNADTPLMAALTPALALSNHAGRCYASAASVTGTAAWAEPADGGYYISAGVTEFLNRLANLAGVRVGCVGYAHSAESIATLTSNPDWSNFLANLTGSGGAFGTFVWIQGHSDAAGGTTASAYQSALASLITTLQAAYPAVAFKTVIVGIGALTATGYTLAQVNAIRQAQLAYVAANPGTTAYVAMLDTPLYDGTHPTQSGQRMLARHVYRAVGKLLGLLPQGDGGAQIVSATRATGSPWVYLTAAQAGGTGWVGVGSTAMQAGQFQVFNSGATTAPYAFNATTPIDLSNPARIGLQLATAPANTQALDIWYRPYADTASVIGAGIYDNLTDASDPDLGGRQVGLYAGALTAPAPGGSSASLPALTTNGAGGGGGAIAPFLQLDANTGLFSDAPGGTVQATNGGIVKAWADQSGAGNHLILPASLSTLGGTLGAGNAPTLATGAQNGLQGVAFNGSQVLTSQASVTWPAKLSAQAFTALTVVRVSAQGGSGAVIWSPQIAGTGNNNNSSYLIHTGGSAGNAQYFNSAWSVIDPTAIVLGTLMKIVLRFDGASTLKIAVNGDARVVAAGSGVTAQAWNQFVLGTYGVLSGFPMTGAVFELDMWSGMADDATEAALLAYATSKWGS